MPRRRFENGPRGRQFACSLRVRLLFPQLELFVFQHLPLLLDLMRQGTHLSALRRHLSALRRYLWGLRRRSGERHGLVARVASVAAATTKFPRPGCSCAFSGPTDGPLMTWVVSLLLFSMALRVLPGRRGSPPPSLRARGRRVPVLAPVIPRGSRSLACDKAGFDAGGGWRGAQNRGPTHEGRAAAAIFGHATRRARVVQHRVMRAPGAAVAHSSTRTCAHAERATPRRSRPPARCADLHIPRGAGAALSGSPHLRRW